MLLNLCLPVLHRVCLNFLHPSVLLMLQPRNTSQRAAQTLRQAVSRNRVGKVGLVSVVRIIEYHATHRLLATNLQRENQQTHGKTTQLAEAAVTTKRVN
jgi:hypothetical protein